MVALSGTASRIRTETEQDLNLLPLPVGLMRHYLLGIGCH
jgi:hypothetical protein